ncbi:MAG: Rho termination factor N-terminal domain-containing protein [Proteobacteria bacterium]|jgi:hypothetical protein|nr:Rho termination factor N-terminal domain-containing protein [Pseudomonadota bacterium]
MGRQIELVKQTIVKEVNKRRSLLTVLNTVKFRRIWNYSTEQDKENLLKDLECRDALFVKDWMNTNPVIELEEMSSQQLKEVAKELGISNWCRLSVPALINAIILERKK